MNIIAKLILFSHSFKDSTHAANLIQYIATREGVVFNAANFKGEVTKKQGDLIKDIVNKFPELKELEEYQKFLKEKSKANASEFLTEAFNFIDDQSVTKEVYLKYISERPRVEKINAHGLFNLSGEANLDKEIENIKNHKGVVWTHIISLKREDAQRLGYDHLEQWQLLLQAKMQKVAESMNIELKNLVWNAAFHNEGHHPHVHVAMYSKDIKQGYLDKESIRKIKSVLMNEIYKEELLSIKQEKTIARNDLKEEFETELDKLYEKIITKNFNVDEKLIDEFIKLAKMLPDKGKNAYGYQSKDIKEQVDKIVRSITENKNIKQLYEKYLDYNKELAAYYSSKEPDTRTINKDEEFKTLKNMVLKVAKKIPSDYDQPNIDKAVQNDIEDINIHGEEAPAKTLEEKLKKYDDAMKNIEDSFKIKQENTAIPDRKKVKEENVAEEKKEVLEMRETSLKNIEDKFCTVLNSYAENNEDFKTVLNCIGNIKNSYLRNYKEESPVIQKNVMSAVNILLSDSELKDDYIKYIGACEDYSLLMNSDKHREVNKDLINLADEIINKINSSIQIKKNEIEKLSGEIYETVQGVEDKFLVLLDEYGHNNAQFKNELNTISQLNIYNSSDVRKLGRYINKSISTALNILINDPRINEKYLTLKEKCEQYSILTGKNKDAELNKQLIDVKNEILNYSSYNTAEYVEEASKYMKTVVNRLSNLENSFLSNLDKYYRNDEKFKEEVNSIANHNNYLYSKSLFDIERPDVEKHLDNLLNIVVSDVSVKSDYEKYIKACEEYAMISGDNKDIEINKGLSGMKNEILNRISLDKEIDVTHYIKRFHRYSDNFRSNIIAGAEKMKKEYMLNPKVDVNYNDYSKQDQDEIKHLVKGVVFDIVDSMYFSAKEGEIQKNKMLRLNNEINMERRKQQYEKHISY